MNEQLKRVSRSLNPVICSYSEKFDGMPVEDKPRFHWFGLRRLFSWALDWERRRRWRAYQKRTQWQSD